MENNTINIIGDASTHADMGGKKEQGPTQSSQAIGGFSLIAAGVAAGLALSFRPDANLPDSLLAGTWYPVHIGLFIAFILSIPGVIGIFNFLKKEPGPLNKIAFIIALFGSLLSVAVVFIQLFIVPGLPATSSQPLPLMNMGISNSLEGLHTFFMFSMFVWVAGWSLIGLALIRSSKVPKYIGIIIIVSILMITFVPVVFNVSSSMFNMVFALFFGAAWVLTGNSIRKYDSPF